MLRQSCHNSTVHNPLRPNLPLRLDPPVFSANYQTLEGLAIFDATAQYRNLYCSFLLFCSCDQHQILVYKNSVSVNVVTRASREKAIICVIFYILALNSIDCTF